MAVYTFVCERLKLFCDFLQFDLQHELVAFYKIFARGPNELFQRKLFCLQRSINFFKQLNDNVKVKMFS